MEKEVKMYKNLILIIVGIIIIIFLGITFAYYISTVAGGKGEISADTETVEITYTDCDESVQGSSCSVLTGSLYPGSDPLVKYFKVTNTGDKDQDVDFNIYFTEVYNEFLKTNNQPELVYSLENASTNEVYVDEEELPTTGLNYQLPLTDSGGNSLTLSVNTGESITFKLTVKLLELNKDQTYNDGKKFRVKLSIKEGATGAAKTLEYLSNLNSSITNNFHSNLPDVTDSGGYGVYTYTHPNGNKSYFFRGLASYTNYNYVKFAGYYWRILRINEDGSLRIMYDGTTSNGSGASTNRLLYNNQATAYNSTSSDNTYIGYMNGTSSASSYQTTHSDATSSTIKTMIDNWFSATFLKTNGSFYDQYNGVIVDEPFCSDRKVVTSLPEAYSDYTVLGYGTNKTLYGAGERFNTGVVANINFECETNDAYTVSNSIGNGKLTYPVGLISADEASAAGAIFTNAVTTTTYIYKGYSYWTMSPAAFNGTDAQAYYVSAAGQLQIGSVTASNGVVPVINLSQVYVSNMIGIGTTNNPFIVSRT